MSTPRYFTLARNGKRDVMSHMYSNLGSVLMDNWTSYDLLDFMIRIDDVMNENPQFGCFLLET